MSDILTGVANLINTGIGLSDYLGGTTSARSYKYQRKLQKHEQQFIERMSNTAHQREVADLQSAGLNPVLSAGGSGATTLSGGGGGSVDAGPSGIDIMNAINTAKQTKAQTEYIKEWQPKIAQSEIDKNEAEAKLTETENRNRSTKTTAMENDEKLSKTWWGRNISPVLRDIFGNGAGTSIANTAVSARNANKMSNAIKNTPHTHVHYH